MNRAIVLALLFVVAVQGPLVSLCRYSCPLTASENSPAGAPCRMAMQASSSHDSLLEWTFCPNEQGTVQAVSAKYEKEFPRPARAHGFQSNSLHLPDITATLLPAVEKEFRFLSLPPALAILRI